MVALAIPIIEAVSKILDRVIPDKAQRDAAKLALMQVENQQVLDEAKVALSAILAEEQSDDPWTSRARPSFLYVIYALILMSLPMGVLTAFAPETSGQIVIGFKDWLSAIPDPFIQLFGIGYLGYCGTRSFDKWKGTAK